MLAVMGNFFVSGREAEGLLRNLTAALAISPITAGISRRSVSTTWQGEMSCCCLRRSSLPTLWTATDSFARMPPFTVGCLMSQTSP